jgi:transglutaminase-like putative cysteine protease
MSDDGGSGGRLAGREYGRVAFAATCVVAVVLTAALVPALATGSGAPGASLVPLPPDAADAGDGAGSGAGGSGGLGALDAGDSQQVGGLGENAFRSQGTETHFTVRSEEPAYWRTGSYDTYTGEGWRRSAPADISAPAAGEAVGYRVDLARAAGSPPTVWRPETLSGPAGLGVTGDGRVETGGRLPEGTTYRGTSRRPPSESEVLAASGRDYPPAVAERYTALPEETRSAVGPFTDEVVGEASDPYETAVAVEDWLETTKSYSLNVSRPEEDVARAFIFEMDAGYCEYFATAMVAMLRSQEVPARYVVGYSTGETVDPNTYRVRALNAHAWVEVYFAEVGWVRFDPTPGDARIAQERRTLQSEGVTDDYDPGTAGSPDERRNGTDPEGTPTSETPTPVTPVTPTSRKSSEGYTLSLNRTAVPGAPVEVSVTEDGAPVAGSAVSVDDRRVGVTDSDGALVTTLPYSESVTVSAAGGETVTTGSSTESSGPGGDGSSAGERSAARTYELPTNATLSLSGDRGAGATVTVTASVEDVPVRNATVTIDGERAGETDGSGRSAVTLPSTPGNVTLRVERGPVVGTRTVAVDAVTVAVDPALGLPVAWTPVEVTAFVGGDPEPGAAVTVGGERVGETGIDGTVTARLPASSAVPVVVAARGGTARTTVANPLANLAAVVVLAVGAVLGSAVALSRADLGLRDLPGAVASGLQRAARTLVAALVGLAVVSERALAMAWRRALLTVAHLRALATGERSAKALAAALRAWLGGLPDRVGVALGTAGAGTGRQRRAAADQAGDGERAAVREAWERFLRHVSVERPDVHTPGQLAAHAIAVDGLPRDAVTTLRDEFRAVEYGPRPSDAAAPGVASAIDAIESEAETGTGAVEGTGEETGDEGEGGSGSAGGSGNGTGAGAGGEP